MNSEFRRKPRRQIAEAISVTDVMTGDVVGRIGNLSETGMLLASETSLNEDALYQLKFELHLDDGSRSEHEVGAHLLWIESLGSPGKSWMGFRFIGIPETLGARLRTWIGEAASKT